MDEVQFDSDTFVARKQPLRATKSSVDFLVSHGWAKNATQAQKLLIGLLVLALIAAAIFFKSAGTELNPSPDKVPSTAGPGTIRK